MVVDWARANVCFFFSFLPERDEREAIDKSNIIKGGLRHAKPRYKGGYNEGPGEDDLPAEVEETGQSDTRRVI
jgi:hypothetical protein